MKKGPGTIPEIVFRPIGVIHSEHQEAAKTPIQPVFARGVPGRVEVNPEFEKGLSDLEGFSHIILLYHFDRAGPLRLMVKPFLDDQERGVFATRAPSRPNPIGLSIVRLVRREGAVLFIEDVDIFDGTPLLDIKPYIPRFDLWDEVRGGWTERVDKETAEERGRRGYQDGGPGNGP